MRRGIAVGLGMLGLLLSVLAYADATTGLDPYEEFGKRLQAAQIVAPVTDNVFGDQVSLYNGATAFDVTEFALPGNNVSPVALRRRFTVDARRFDPGYLGGFGDWDLDIPYIEAVVTTDNGWTLNGGSSARCSDTTDALNTRVPGMAGPIVAPLNIIWNGDQLHIPGVGDQELLVNNQSKSPAYASAGTYRWVTTGSWKVSCLNTTANGYPGQAFVAVSPTGTAYTFNWVVVRTVPSVFVMTETDGSAIDNIYANRQRVFMLVTKVQDRFGNSVTYSYNASGQLTGMVSSDGRSMTLAWSGNTIASASSALGTWHYSYGTDSMGRTVLTAVTRPDGSKWTYTIVSGALETHKPSAKKCTRTEPCPTEHCQLTPYANTGSFTYMVGAPSGAKATFAFQYLRNYRVGVPKSCADGNPDHAYPTVYTFFDNFSLVSKQVTGPGLSTMTWTYAMGGVADDESGSAPGYFDASILYDSNALVYLPGGSCGANNTGRAVTVTAPTRITVYTFGNVYGCNAGRLLQTTIKTLSGTALKTTTNIYLSESAALNQTFADIAGVDQLGNDIHPTANRNRPVVSTQVAQDGATFTTAVNSFDAFVRAISATGSSSLGYSKTDTTTYANDLSRWVLGLVTQTATNGIVSSSTNYNSLDQPTSQYAFGKLVSTKAWNADGTLASITDGGGHTTSLVGWTRGLPTKVTFADDTAESAAINSAGWITALTDEVGFTTNYAYDAMGRLAEISYPAGDSVAWNPTLLAFAPVGSSEFGIPGGHWKQVVHTGNGYVVTVFDAFWRPLVTEHYDAGNTGGTLSQVVQRYDAGGRKVFTSYPTRSATSYTQALPGIHTSYDALGRVTEVQQDSNLGLLPTITRYLSGFETRVTNPRGNSTVTSYQAFGQPTFQWPVTVTAPDGELTKTVRDVFGKPLSVTRTDTTGGAPSLTRSFVYNAYQELCGRTEPETGTTAYGYDLAGNLIWSAVGLATTSACYSEGDASGSGRMMARAYDARNRVTSINYADKFSNTSYAYAADGAMTSASVANGGFPVTTSYTYDKRRLLTSEAQSLPSTPALALGYGYDTNGHLSALVYPDGRSITYLPNALGQPTQAGSYATGVSYHPNGAIARFTLGGGVVHTMTEDERGLPEHVTGEYGSTVFQDTSYDYDGNGDVAAITDGLPGNVGNVDMTYDALDRLTEATSPMFGGSGEALYSYDALNNLRSASLGNQSSFDYLYNANNQLTELTDPVGGGAIVDYAYDAQGNLAKKNSQVYQFDTANRLESVPGVASYHYDAAGRRVQKIETASLATLDSDYSHTGRLLYQWDPVTLNSTDYVYVGNALVARVVGNQSEVIGNVDSVTSDPTPLLKGWACSTGITTPIGVEVFAGGPSGNNGIRVAAAAADQPSEPAIGAACHTNGATYRFVIPLTDTLRAQYGGEAIYMYGDSPVGNSNGELNSSGAYTIPVNPGAPASPAQLTVPASTSTASVTLAWSAVSTATNYVVQQQFNDGAWAQVYNGSGTSASLSNLPDGKYLYRVQACATAGCSAPTVSSVMTAAFIPLSPTSITVPASSYNPSFAVSWSAAAKATNYVLEESVNGGSWGVLHSANVTSYTVTVSASGNYKFQVAACAAGGCSPFKASGNVAVTLPPASAPALSGPTSSASGTFKLSWASVSGATRYQLNQNIGGHVTTPYNAGGTSWTSSNLANGTYNYAVYPCNAAGCGPGSNGIAVKVLHAPPTPASVSAPSNVQLNETFVVSWSAASGATSYTLQQTNTDNGTVRTKYTGPATSTTTEIGLPGFYQFTVQACNSAGCSGWRAAGTTDAERAGRIMAVPASGSSP